MTLPSGLIKKYLRHACLKKRHLKEAGLFEGRISAQ
jgi:hypothetical protein